MSCACALRKRYGRRPRIAPEHLAKGRHVIAEMMRHPGKWELITDAVRANVPGAGAIEHAAITTAVGRLLLAAAAAEV